MRQVEDITVGCYVSLGKRWWSEAPIGIVEKICSYEDAKKYIAERNSNFKFRRGTDSTTVWIIHYLYNDNYATWTKWDIEATFRNEHNYKWFITPKEIKEVKLHLIK